EIERSTITRRSEEDGLFPLERSLPKSNARPLPGDRRKGEQNRKKFLASSKIEPAIPILGFTGELRDERSSYVTQTGSDNREGKHKAITLEAVGPLTAGGVFASARN
ncbi:hypothetical protein SDJN02_05241, partial [Cucurbita argyrosperma subsp. argyrosperma]